MSSDPPRDAAPTPDGERWWQRAIYFVIVNTLRAAARVLFLARYRGRNLVPRSGAFVLVANHVSFLDPPVAGIASPRRIHYMARASLFRNRFFGGLIRILGSHPIVREGTDRRGLMATIEVLQQGQPIVVFPEGHRSRDGSFQPFQRGFLLLVKRARVPVVPAWIDGTRKILPPSARFPGWARIRVRFGPPIPWDEAVELGAAGIRERVAALQDWDGGGTVPGN